MKLSSKVNGDNMNIKIRHQLENMEERKYSDFQSALHPGVNNILGIRLPKLREYARQLVKEHGIDLLDETEDYYFEETMLRGMIIGYLKIDPEERISLIRNFSPHINSWGICDSFVGTLKFTQKNQQLVWDFLQTYISSEKEFEQRFAAVMMLSYFVNQTYIEQTLTALKSIGAAEYYASMAVAWALAECYIKFPDNTISYFTENCFDKDTHNRAIQKICDSYRVDNDKKDSLRKLRRQH